MFDMGRDGAIRVDPVDRPLKHMRSYLPPARPYYDQFTITIMKPFMAQKKKEMWLMLVVLLAWQGDEM